MSHSDSTEAVYSMPLVNPETGCASRSFDVSSKIDRVEDGKVIDWKIVGDPQMYILKRQLAFQPEIYALQLRNAGGEPTEVVYRMVVPPSIKLCKTKDRWGEVPNSESVPFYEERCVKWIHQQYDRHVVEQALFVNESRMASAQGFMWDCGKQVLSCRAAQRWLPNMYACDNWNRTCAYAPLCQHVTTCHGGSYQSYCQSAPEVEYKYNADAHPELDGAGLREDGDLGILTFSSMTTLANCQLLYLWKYEMKLRVFREEGHEALRQGSVAHVGLEHCVKGGQEAASKAIEQWETDNLVLGEDAARKQLQEIARSRAIVRVADARWQLSAGKNV